MKSKQLLSIVFSLIMFTGVTAGSAAFAESDEYDKGMRGKLDRYCEMTDQEKIDFISEHDKAADHVAKMNEYCELDQVQRDAYIEEHKDDYKMNHDKDIRDMMNRYCEMSDQEKRDYISEHVKAEKHVAKMNEYCLLDEDARNDYINDYTKDIRDMMNRYCEMTDQEKQDFISEHVKAEKHVAKMNEYCLLDEDARNDYIKDYREEYKSNMKDKMMDKDSRPHMDYDRLCELSETDRALKIDDPEKLDRISEWCDMTPEERDTFKRENHDGMKDKMRDMKMDKKHDFDGMSDVAKDRMSDVAKVKLHDKAMKFSDESKRLKAMIMDKRDISDERTDEIRMKYEEKHGNFDEKKLELKMKFKNHMALMKIEISDERKSAIKDRVAEMKAFKIDLRERSSELSDEEKQELRAEFIEMAKDMQLAWISPRHQMNAGIDAAEIECREGFSLVLKESNGKAMCLKADTALKMIERGIAVPAI